MFKQLLKVWSEQIYTQQLVNEFMTMLSNSEKMLTYALKVLTQESSGKKFDKKIYKKDQTINLAEQDIRKRVLIHLSTNPNCNLPACLSLISVVKDAERVGDYVKNLFELNRFYKDSRKDSELFNKLFETSATELIELFGKVSTAFKNSDKDIAVEAIHLGHEIALKCEDVIEDVVKSDYNARQAVVIALGARYIKRISIHLTNIVTSVTNPLPELDFIRMDKEKQSDKKPGGNYLEIKSSNE
ncbi:MAG TPA: PhoU domain-containing protein [Anaerolineae bacterium]|nr:PhoU domain-containing protein [Anaerolineae bacterium]